MHVWRHQLEFAFSGVRDGFLVGCTCFVIEDLKVNSEASGFQTGHDGVVRCNTVLVTPGFECLVQDEVCISMVGNHDVLIA